VQQHRPLGNGQVITMMRTTVSTQPQIIIVVCCITLRRSAYGAWGNYSVHGADGKKTTDATFIGHIPCVTAAITTTAKRAFTTSRAGTMTLQTAGSLMRMGSYQLWIFRLSICLLTVVIILSTTLTHLGTFLC